jgi:hypothetical protein
MEPKALAWKKKHYSNYHYQSFTKQGGARPPLMKATHIYLSSLMTNSKHNPYLSFFASDEQLALTVNE